MTKSVAALPIGWAVTSVSNACQKIQDGTHFSPRVQLTHGKYRYVTAKNVRPTGLDLSDIAYLRDADHRAIYARCDTRRNDVLLVKDGVNAGDAAINTLDDEISLLSSVCFLRPRSAVLTPAFLRYYLLSPEAFERLTGSLTGTAIRRIVLHRVRGLPVLIAPLPEQHRIVEAIERYLTRLDAAVATLERVRRNLTRYRASVLKAAVEGRLVPTEAELARAENRDYEPASVLLEGILIERRRRWQEAGRRGKYEEPAAPDTTEPPELPDGWCLANLDLLKEFSLYGPRFSSDDYVDDGRLVLRTSDISESGKVNLATAPRLQLDDEEFVKYRVEVGDLLVTRTGSLGTLAVFNDVVDAIPGAYLIQFRLAAPLDSSWFCFYLLKSPTGQARLKGGGAGVGRPNLNAPTIESIAFGLPPLAEQTRILAEVERLLSITYALDHEVALSLSRCVRLRQSILRWAFEGKLADQDPDDEPASVLLERIRGERATAAPARAATRFRASRPGPRTGAGH